MVARFQPDKTVFNASSARPDIVNKTQIRSAHLWRIREQWQPLTDNLICLTDTFQCQLVALLIRGRVSYLHTLRPAVADRRDTNRVNVCNQRATLERGQHTQ